MSLLLDTHALIWVMRDDTRVGAAMRQTLRDPDNEVLVSIVSFWEIAVKARLGRLPEDPQDIAARLPSSGLRLLDLKLTHLLALRQLAVVRRHRDPFDHVLIAQAKAERLTFVSDDAHVGRYPLAVLRCS